MSKMGSHDPFKHLKHKLWPKERPKIKLIIWLLATKSQEFPRFLCAQVACDIQLKKSWLGLQLCFRPHLNWRSAHKVMGPQSCKSPNFGNFGTPRTKWHLGANLVHRHIIYYKGEGGGFPQFRVVLSLVSLCLLMVCPCIKALQLRIN